MSVGGYIALGGFVRGSDGGLVCVYFISWYVRVCFFFFFFQAEDGIRDVAVTGVQTCALPIYLLRHVHGLVARHYAVCVRVIAMSCSCLTCFQAAATAPSCHPPLPLIAAQPRRSEERRVGKECRSRGSADPEKKKVVERDKASQ